MAFVYFQNRHQLFFSSCGVVRWSSSSASLSRTTWTPPHTPQNEVNISIDALSGTSGKITRIRSDGASNNSLRPHWSHGWTFQLRRSWRYFSVTIRRSSPDGAMNLISAPCATDVNCCGWFRTRPVKTSLSSQPVTVTHMGKLGDVVD